VGGDPGVDPLRRSAFHRGQRLDRATQVAASTDIRALIE